MEARSPDEDAGVSEKSLVRTPENYCEYTTGDWGTQETRYVQQPMWDNEWELVKKAIEIHYFCQAITSVHPQPITQGTTVATVGP